MWVGCIDHVLVTIDDTSVVNITLGPYCRIFAIGQMKSRTSGITLVPEVIYDDRIKFIPTNTLYIRSKIFI